MLLSRFIARMSSVGLMILSAGVVSGQDYPNKPIRIVTSAAGGNSDFAARIIAQGLSPGLNQPVLVVNSGGGGVIPIEVVAKAPPDGYTLLVTGAVLWIFPLLQKAPYDAVSDFSPLSLITREVFIVAAHPSLPVKSLKELIALAKAKPGVLNYGSVTAGGSTHLAMELFKSMAGANIVQVPYKGNAASVTALISGEVQVMIADAGVTVPHVKSGKLRALAVTSATPSALAPGLPTVAASGVPGYEWVGRTGIWAPAKTPGAIIDRLSQEIVRLLNRADVKERFLGAGGETVGNSPEQFAATIKSDIATISKVIKDAGIKVN